MRRLVIAIISILSITSCSEKTESMNYSEDIGNLKEDILGASILEHEQGIDVQTIKIKGIEYHYSMVSALDFVQRSGNTVASEDLEDLEKESVVIFEFTTDKATQSAFESAEMKLEKDDAIQYLMSGISNDFVIKQDGTEFKPAGCNYEGQIGEQNKIRVMFFMNGLDKNDPFTIEYYDQLFGKGLMKFTNSNQQILS